MPNSTKPVILIIEDNEQLVRAYQDMFHEEFDLAIAYDGVTGVDLSMKRQPKLILLDLMLPKMNGYDVLRRLKQNAATAEIPVVVLTNRDTELNTCLQLGAVEAIVKSKISLVALLDRIRAYVKGEVVPAQPVDSN